MCSRKDRYAVKTDSDEKRNGCCDVKVETVYIIKDLPESATEKKPKKKRKKKKVLPPFTPKPSSNKEWNARKIQAWWRGTLVRRTLLKAALSAWIIQCWWRKTQAKRLEMKRLMALHWMIQETKACVTVQSWVRMLQTRQQYRRLHYAAHVIQVAWRWYNCHTRGFFQGSYELIENQLSLQLNIFLGSQGQRIRQRQQGPLMTLSRHGIFKHKAAEEMKRIKIWGLPSLLSTDTGYARLFGNCLLCTFCLRRLRRRILHGGFRTAGRIACQKLNVVTNYPLKLGPQAAKKIQAWWRGTLVRRTLLKAALSAWIIQCWWRKTQAKRLEMKRLMALRWMTQETRACVTVQSWVRMLQTRQQYRRLHYAAHVIQVAWRWYNCHTRGFFQEPWTTSKCPFPLAVLDAHSP
ncbi:IQ domain-containing protein F5-like [Sigmodon hispidus]